MEGFSPMYPYWTLKVLSYNNPLKSFEQISEDVMNAFDACMWCMPRWEGEEGVSISCFFPTHTCYVTFIKLSHSRYKEEKTYLGLGPFKHVYRCLGLSLQKLKLKLTPNWLLYCSLRIFYRKSTAPVRSNFCRLADLD